MQRNVRLSVENVEVNSQTSVAVLYTKQSMKKSIN